MNGGRVVIAANGASTPLGALLIITAIACACVHIGFNISQWIDKAIPTRRLLTIFARYWVALLILAALATFA